MARCSTARSSFRPLPGYLISQFISETTKHHIQVSVPFRGISFLNIHNQRKHLNIGFPSPSGVSHFSIRHIGKVNALLKFPSPSGVSHFSIPKRRSENRTPIEFPSPSGVSHFSIIVNVTLTNYELAVSVPFRGISFLNISFTSFMIFSLLVSVPFRGISFLNSVPGAAGALKMDKFPSPSGVSHFSMGRRKVKTGTVLFPSPSGVSHFSID